MRSSILVFSSSSPLAGVQAQTLFTLWQQQRQQEEFLRAYNKNNTGRNNTEKAYRDYLDLYIRFQTKSSRPASKPVGHASAHRPAELQNFRSQIADGFMNDDNSLNTAGRSFFAPQPERSPHFIISIYLIKDDDTSAAFPKSPGRRTSS